MKKAIIPLLMLAACTPKFIPNKAVQVKLIAYQWQRHYKVALHLVNDTGAVITYYKQHSGYVRYDKFIGDWYTLHIDSTVIKCDTLQRGILKRNQ